MIFIGEKFSLGACEFLMFWKTSFSEEKKQFGQSLFSCRSFNGRQWSDLIGR